MTRVIDVWIYKLGQDGEVHPKNEGYRQLTVSQAKHLLTKGSVILRGRCTPRAIDIYHMFTSDTYVS
jgi:hypothetical protein